MHKKRWAALVLAAALALTGCSFGGVGGGGSAAQKIDRPAVESAELQFTHPAAGDTVAVFDTSAGVFRAVLFPDKVPQAYDNFVGLVQAGYYNGLTVSRVESGFVVEAGQGADGRGNTIWNGSYNITVILRRILLIWSKYILFRIHNKPVVLAILVFQTYHPDLLIWGLVRKYIPVLISCRTGSKAFRCFQTILVHHK